jgi:diguanylate cyclase (GGDEF)-like protein
MSLDTGDRTRYARLEPVKTTPALAAGRDFSGSMTQFIVDYLLDHQPPKTLDVVLQLAGETRSAATLRDVNSWSSYAQYRRLLQATGQVLGGARMLETVGRHMFDSIRNPELAEAMRSLGAPAAAYAAISGVSESVAPGCELAVEVLGENECRVQWRIKDVNDPFPEFCAYELGLLAAIPEMFGYPSAQIFQETCECDGAPHCQALLHWGDDDEHGTQLRSAEMRTRMAEARLDELQRAVADVVSGDGVEAVLTKVVAAARRAVQAPAFILDIQANPTANRFTLTEGITTTAAADVIEGLRAGAALADGANVAESEVRSERARYGHLVAIRGELGSFEPHEHAVLDSYARLAASALDSEVAIVDARRQATAAQALLALSTSLVDLASGEEMALRLARAVPSVLDCDRVLVCLTDAGSVTAQVRASFGFDHATEMALRSLQIHAPLAKRRSDPVLYRHPVGIEMAAVDAILRDSGSVRTCSFAIMSNAEMFGWITVDVTANPERLDDDVAIRERLHGLASQAAIAIRNARLLEDIRHQALHDSLTGLPNRALILDRVNQAIARSRRDHIQLALFFIDLDAFKDVNDTLGHGTGDDLLQAVAARFSGTLRGSDTVARLGGDEFVVLAEGTSLDAGPELIAERLLAVLAEPFHLGEHQKTTLTVSASIGIAVGRRDNAEDLFRDADVALYAAKDAGKNRYVTFEDHMQDTLRYRHEIEIDLQAAIGTDQFFLLYQPIFGLEHMTVLGVEALLRWNHPTKGLMQPDEFIPALEASGLIVPVGRWALNEACRQAMEWRTRGQLTHMSVNVSGRQLDAASLVEDVRDALTESGLPPQALTLEITETCLMRDTKGAIRQLHALKKLGVRIAIDDFGTGYSSLAYLQQFPVDSLKIDKSFIAGMAKTPEGDALIHTLIQLGKALKIETLAEGIEEPSQLTQLQAENCEVGQGYLFARPLAPADVEEFFRTVK